MTSQAKNQSFDSLMSSFSPAHAPLPAAAVGHGALASAGRSDVQLERLRHGGTPEAENQGRWGQLGRAVQSSSWGGKNGCIVI